MENKQKKIDEIEVAETEAVDYTLLETGKEFEAVVVDVSPVGVFEHAKFGNKPFVDIMVEFKGSKEQLKLFLPKSKFIRSNSTAGKLLKNAKVSTLRALIGTIVLLKANKDGYLRFACED